MNKIALRALLATSLAVYALAGTPALGYDYHHCLGNRIDWGRTAVTFYPAKLSFQPGAARPPLDAAIDAWNNHAPGTRFRFSLVYDDATTLQSGDGKNSVAFTSGYDWGTALGVALQRWNCGDLTEVDVLFNPAYSWTYETLPASPISSSSPYNLTLVGIHEFGHAFGLNHQKSAVATMNDRYPSGGTLGNSNFIHPHADDVLGNRVGYGTCCTERDVYASAYKSTSSIDTNWITAPGQAFRGHPVGFQFTIGNRGTVQESARVQFYLSADRFISTADTLLGAATYSLGAGVTSTFFVNTVIPVGQPSGSYYLGYVVDPLGSIPEVDESNNAVALVSSTFVPSTSPPIACFTASPTSGPGPLLVSVNAGCSSDPDGSIVSYSWDFGDGGRGSGVATDHWYDYGSYTITLTVTDNHGLTSQSQEFIFVSGCPECPTCEIC
ncbi:MAG TPA: PKD domain-containing protein [Thermoanaerobaculia bacterium]|nr:PKD domain-containing protein [Thermoanaerobaculia bacterium]